MKLQVNGIEEIEITDPKGLCKLAQLGTPVGASGGTIQPQPTPLYPRPGSGAYPQPPIPTNFPPGVSPIPGYGDIVPIKPTTYTRHIVDNEDGAYRAKWGIGGPMIQRAAHEVDPDKWQKNWQAGVNGEEEADGHGNDR